MSAQERVDNAIKSKPVVVFSKSYCPFCIEAKELLKSFNIPADKIEIQEIENDDSCDALQDYLKQLTGARSVPRIFIGGKSIGGCSDLKALHASGALKTQLQEAGAI